jgi:hypothetical protein
MGAFPYVDLVGLQGTCWAGYMCAAGCRVVTRACCGGGPRESPRTLEAALLSFVISFLSPWLILSSGFPYLPYLCFICSWSRGPPGMGVAANICSKQSRTAYKDDPPAWGLGVGLQLLTVKNKLVTKCHKGPRTWHEWDGI